MVDTTPGNSQNLRSAPQKQPIPKVANSVPTGKGGTSGAPLTKCLAGTAIRSVRPGNASAAVGSLDLVLVPKSDIRTPITTLSGEFHFGGVPRLGLSRRSPNA